MSKYVFVTGGVTSSLGKGITGAAAESREVVRVHDTLKDPRYIASHPWMGLLTLFQLRGQQELPYRAMTVAYEHHMKCDLTGYPKNVRPRALSIFSKIVAVADGFDAATSRRSYQTDPLSPAAVLAGMRDNPRRGFDSVVVKAFINLTGVYPVGTLVRLESGHLAVVEELHQDNLLSPVVRVIYHAGGQGPLLHFHAGTGECEWRGASTVPMGFMSGFPLGTPCKNDLGPGDILGLITDGIFEYENPEMEAFGQERVSELVKKYQHESMSKLLEQIVHEVERFANLAPQNDDMTLLLVRRLPA